MLKVRIYNRKNSATGLFGDILQPSQERTFEIDPEVRSKAEVTEELRRLEKAGEITVIDAIDTDEFHVEPTPEPPVTKRDHVDAGVIALKDAPGRAIGIGASESVGVSDDLLTSADPEPEEVAAVAEMADAAVADPDGSIDLGPSGDPEPEPEEEPEPPMPDVTDDDFDEDDVDTDDEDED